MRRAARKALLVGPVLLVGLALAWLAAFDIDRYHDEITAWLSNTTGRAVSIGSGVELDLLPVPELRLRDLRLANTDWGTAENALVVARLGLRVELLPLLLEGRLVVPRAELQGVELNLQRNAEGAVNWRYGDGAAETASGGLVNAPVIVFDGIRLTDVRVRFDDAVRDRQVALDLRELNLSSPRLDQPLTAHARGEVAGAALEFSAQLTTLAALRARREAALSLLLHVDDVTLRLHGSIPALQDAGKMVFDVDLQAPTLGDVVGAVARLLPDASVLGELAPRTMALAPVALRAGLSWPDADSARLDDLQLRGGDSALDGWLQLGTRDRLRLDGVLSGDLLVLANPIGTDSGPDRTRVFSDTPLAWQALERIDVGLLLRAKELRLGGATLSDVDLSLALDAGEATVRPSFSQAGGSVHGELRASVGERRVRLKLDGDGVELGRLQREFGAGDEVSGGVASFALTLAGEGASAHELAASLNGSVLVQAGAARVDSDLLAFASGDLLLQLARQLGLGEGDRMQLHCGVANVHVERGVASAQRGIGLRFERANLIGGGSVDLGAETLDLNLALQSREGAGLSIGSTLANLVAVRGTLTEPVVEASAEGVAAAGLKVGAAVLTGGLSLLANVLFDRVTASADPCATALAADTATPSDEETASKPEAVTPRSRRNDD